MSQKIVKVSTPFPDWPLIRQTPNSRGIWGDYKFIVNEDIEECDYWVVYEGLEKPESVICSKENTLLVTCEPNTVKTYATGFISQFSKIISSHTNISHLGLTLSQQSLMWMVGGKYKGGTWGGFSKDYDELSQINNYNKEKLISVVLSKKDQTIGHEKKNKFVRELKSYFGDKLDVFGVGINEIEDKWDAIGNYKYHIVLENSSINDYWTEKLADAYLGGAYPFYFGCPNLEKYFSNHAFTKLNVDNLQESIGIIENEVNNNTYENSIAEIQQARNLILNKYNLFPMLVDFIDKDYGSEGKINIMLFDEHRFKKTTLLTHLKNLLKK